MTNEVLSVIYAATGLLALITLVHHLRYGEGWSLADVVIVLAVGPLVGWVLVVFIGIGALLFSDFWSRPRWFKKSNKSSSGALTTAELELMVQLAAQPCPQRTSARPSQDRRVFRFGDATQSPVRHGQPG